jgi:hypothetical protein
MEGVRSTTTGPRTYFCRQRKEWVPRQMHEGLQLSSFDALEQAAAGRIKCPSCQQSRSLYCHLCLLALTPTPQVHLDFNLWVCVRTLA